MPCGQDPQTFVPNVDSGGFVPIMNHPAYADPVPVRERQLGVDHSEATAQAGRWKPAIDHRQVLAVPLALVLQLTAELSHRGIGETLSQLGSRKALQRQVLDAQTVVFVDQLGGQFMEEVLSLRLFLRFGGLQPGVRRKPLQSNCLREKTEVARIPPQLSFIQRFRAILGQPTP